MGEIKKISQNGTGVQSQGKMGSKKKKKVVFVVLLILLSITALASFFIKKAVDHRKWIEHMTATVSVDTFHEGIFIDDIDLSGKTLEEAKSELVKSVIERLEGVYFSLLFQDKVWKLNCMDLSVSVDIDDKIQKAYNIGREGGLEKRYKEVVETREKGLSLHTEIKHDISGLRSRIEAIAREIYQEPKDARLEFLPDNSDQVFKIVEEQYGYALDVDELMSIIKNRIENQQYGEIVLTPKEAKPQIVKSDLERLTHRIVQFSTDLSGNTSNRKHNVRYALSKFNGYRLDPGEILSFNKVVGQRTLAKGFKMAPVITADKRLEDAPGGGVCQASTTLYNAALRADLTIVERYHHSFPVAYIPIGLDATVNYGGADVKIKNNRDTPVFFRTFYSGDRVYVEIYGEAFPNNGEIKCTSQVTATIAAPEPEMREDTAGEFVSTPGGQVTYVQSRPGYKVTSYKTYYENGQKVWTKVIAYDYYRPIRGIIYYRPVVVEPSPPPTDNNTPPGDPGIEEPGDQGGQGNQGAPGDGNNPGEQ